MSRSASPAALRAHRCPRCGHRGIERASRRGAVEELLLPLVGLRPYRCLRCLRRFYDRPRGRPLPVA
jgi:DNA-directed RNA polymerase subunit RPC12/RpoP